MKKYKIDNYIVTANSVHDAVSIVWQIKDAYSNGVILEKHETYKGPNGQFTVVKVRRDNGRIQYVVTSDKRDIDAGDKMPSGTIENDLASAIKTAKEYANARKRNSDDFDKDYARESQAVEKDVKKANEDYNRLGNKSASELFEMMGYKRDGHKYYKSNGSYTRVIVFNDFDDIKYYVLKDGVIPRGWTLTKTKWYDSITDQRVFGFGNFPYEYWLKNNDGGWFLAAFSKKKYDRSEIEALRNKYKLKNGKLPDYQEKIVDSIKDGKYVSELKPGDVITKKDGSKWDVVLVRHTPFGIQVRMNSKTSPVKTEEITYRPTDMLVYDSIKDARRINYDDDIIEVTLNGKVVFKGYAEDWLDNNFDSNFKWTGSQYEASNAKGKWVVRVIDSFQKDSLTVRDVIQSLVTEETSAIASYNVALETLKDHIPDEAYEAIKAIRDDEQRHVENLYAVLNGNVTPKNLEN